MAYSTFSGDELLGTAQQWRKYELSFQSDIPYDNPLYDVKFYAEFTSPAGKVKRISGFWDGEKEWKVRFMPSETGEWHYKTHCSDVANPRLNTRQGSFICEKNFNELAIYQKGPVMYAKDEYHLKHADGTPFFWAACTAWNGTLKSTEAEWDFYLRHRTEHHYSVVQFVTTQWRGCEADSQLQTAYTYNKRMEINPVFFQHLDQKIDKINAYGLVAAPVLLWSLPFGKGKELSPGYSLPREDAILLARYMVARYGAHHVIWILGGDGLFVNLNEKRWKEIGREVFDDEHPGVVALHPMGKSWIGDAYAQEKWLDVIGYQSGHNNDKASVEFITKGPVTKKWHQLPPRPVINMEPCYEEIHHRITDEDVRHAAYGSLFAAPLAGISYGANGIWPWIRPGEKIVNHGALGKRAPGSWRRSLDLPGSIQMGYLADFIKQFAWWQLKPDPGLLAEQPGDHQFHQFISVVRRDDYHLVLAYVPVAATVKMYNHFPWFYRVRWFNPKENIYSPAKEMAPTEEDVVMFSSPASTDLILILEKK